MASRRRSARTAADESTELPGRFMATSRLEICGMTVAATSEVAPPSPPAAAAAVGVPDPDRGVPAAPPPPGLSTVLPTLPPLRISPGPVVRLVTAALAVRGDDCADSGGGSGR